MSGSSPLVPPVSVFSSCCHPVFCTLDVWFLAPIPAFWSLHAGFCYCRCLLTAVFSVRTSSCSSSPAPSLCVDTTHTSHLADPLPLCWRPTSLSLPDAPGYQTFPDMMCRMDTTPRPVILLQVHPDLDKKVNKQIVPSTCIPLAWYSLRYFADMAVTQFMNLIILKF